MEQEKLMEGLNENTTGIYEGFVDSNRGGIAMKLALGALGIAVGVGTVLVLKKRKARKNAEVEEIETEIYDDCDEE